MVEGSLWVYGKTDLTDFYRGSLTLRQLWVRIQAAIAEPSPLRAVLEREVEADEQKQQALDIDAALAPFARKG